MSGIAYTVRNGAYDDNMGDKDEQGRMGMTDTQVNRSSRTLLDKVWDSHVVRTAPGEPDLLYVDLHLIHEATSPQAFEGLRMAGRRVRRPDLTIGTADHTTPTVGDIDTIDDT